MTKPKRPTGRPTDYTPDIAAVILERMTHGRSVRSIAKDEDMPAMSTIFKWLIEHKDFSEQYAGACEQRAEAIFEETIEIADDNRGDYTVDEDGNEIVNHENIQRARLRVDTRKWFVSKLAPKKYGDKTLIGSDPENPLPAADNADIARQVAFMLAKEGRK